MTIYLLNISEDIGEPFYTSGAFKTPGSAVEVGEEEVRLLRESGCINVHYHLQEVDLQP